MNTVSVIGAAVVDVYAAPFLLQVRDLFVNDNFLSQSQRVSVVK